MNSQNKLNAIVHQPVTCNICMETYSSDKKPLILKCGHTFCNYCLNFLLKQTTINEIKCSFCKVVTYLRNIDELIVNYAILSLAELYNNSSIDENTILKTTTSCSSTNNFQNENVIKLFNINYKNCECFYQLNDNPDNIMELSHCNTCNINFCPHLTEYHLRENPEQSHDFDSLVNHINNQASILEKSLKSYRDLSNKQSHLMETIQQFDIENFIQNEKDNIQKFYVDLKQELVLNENIILKSMDEAIDVYKNRVKDVIPKIEIYQKTLTKYNDRIKDFVRFKITPNKEKVKFLNIYNIDSIFDVIQDFSKQIDDKFNKLITSKEFLENIEKISRDFQNYKNEFCSSYETINKKFKNKFRTCYLEHTKFLK